MPPSLLSWWLVVATATASALGPEQPQSQRILSIEEYGGVSDAVAFQIGAPLWSFRALEGGDGEHENVAQDNDDAAANEFFSRNMVHVSAVSVNNTRAFNRAIKDAKPGDTVLVPDGRSYTLIGGVTAFRKNNITIDFAGSVHYLYDRSVWPFDGFPNKHKGNQSSSYNPGVTIYGCSHLTITSSSESPAQVNVDYKKNEVFLVDSKRFHGGVINGNGKPWWNDAISGRLPDKIGDSRPKLVHVKESSDLLIEKVTLLNSPFWTLTVEAVRAEIRGVKILVDRKYQATLMAPVPTEPNPELTATERKLIHIPIPIDDLPDWVGRRLNQPQDLNTDGIDPIGKDIWVHDCVIQNADDSIAVKPRGRSRYSILPNCTSNITIENMVLTGFGASIGSVGPTTNHNCVDNVVFRNISMPGTGKGIYIKSDGSDCHNVSSQITNILYDGIYMYSPFWWPIWIGPQQQHEPNARIGLKCPLTFPLPGSTRCPTQGCVNFENITLRNIQIYDPVISPGVILGNATNPIRNLTIENLVVHGSKYKPWYGKWPFHEKRFPWEGRVKCANAEGSCTNCHPAPHCLIG